jgi:hypothetical protein
MEQQTGTFAVKKGLAQMLKRWRHHGCGHA